MELAWPAALAICPTLVGVAVGRPKLYWLCAPYIALFAVYALGFALGSASGANALDSVLHSNLPAIPGMTLEIAKELWAREKAATPAPFVVPAVTVLATHAILTWLVFIAGPYEKRPQAGVSSSDE